MLNLSFPNITENSNIIVQKYCSENRSTAFHTSKGCSYVTSKENWNHLFLHIEEEYFYFTHSKWKKILSGLEQAVELVFLFKSMFEHTWKTIYESQNIITHMDCIVPFFFYKWVLYAECCNTFYNISKT